MFMVLVAYLYYEYQLEGFRTFQGDNECNCYKKKNLINCTSCTNCGMCLKNGKAKCIPGDHLGPYFEDGCQKWVNSTIVAPFKNANKQDAYMVRPWGFPYKDHTWDYFGEQRPFYSLTSETDRATL